MKKTGAWSSYLGEALRQVREVQRAVWEHQRFHGYSGMARVVSGGMALVAAAAMSSPWVPNVPRAHILGWGLVFLASMVINGAALLYWFLNDPRVARDVRRLRPIVDAFPPLIVGAVLTLGLILGGQHRFLFGVWMSMFGLSHLATRHVLPPLITLVGVFYLGCGLVGILYPGVRFLNPWPMGAVFFGGEMAGGLILHFDARRNLEQAQSGEPWEPLARTGDGA